MRHQELFLDLEGTIINSIDDPTFILGAVDCNWFNRLVGESMNVHLFSWAITNQKDEVNNKFLIGEVEDRLGIRFKSIVLRDEMFPLFRRRFGMIDMIDFEDLCRSLGKEFVFQTFIRENMQAFMPRPSNFILLDDMVDDTTLTVEDEVGLVRISTLDVKRRIEAK